MAALLDAAAGLELQEQLGGQQQQQVQQGDVGVGPGAGVGTGVRVGVEGAGGSGEAADEEQPWFGGEGHGARRVRRAVRRRAGGGGGEEGGAGVGAAAGEGDRKARAGAGDSGQGSTCSRKSKMGCWLHVQQEVENGALLAKGVTTCAFFSAMRACRSVWPPSLVSLPVPCGAFQGGVPNHGICSPTHYARAALRCPVPGAARPEGAAGGWQLMLSVSTPHNPEVRPRA